MSATVVSCCQVTPALGDPAANRELAADAISHAAAQGASVVVLPELVSSGYVFEDRAEAQASAEAADGATVTLWARLAADHGVVIVGGFCERTAGHGVSRHNDHPRPGRDAGPGRRRRPGPRGRALARTGSGGAPVAPVASADAAR